MPGRSLSKGRAVRLGRLAARLLPAIALVALLPPSRDVVLPAQDGQAGLSVGAPPNIVLIVTDDQRWDTISAQFMPNVQSLLVSKGITFANGFVVNSYCCPSRATILTGKYSHSTLVYGNTPPYGGFSSFTDDDNTIATWLQAAGYRTSLMGKYLNEYKSEYIPPGWSHWVSFLDAPNGGAYYDYTLDVDGTLVSYDHADVDYSTDVLAGYADEFIRDTEPGQPLFLYFAPFAPHEPTTPATKYKNRFSRLPPLRPPNYNEADVSDKPAWVQALPSLPGWKSTKIDNSRRNQFRTLLSVDDSVKTIVDALSDTGRLSNTLIVYTSDNGWALGEHRWNQKMVAYEESIRVPMIVRFDALVPTSRTDTHMVANLDLAPTFAAAAGVNAPEAEGANMLPLFTNLDAAWRHTFLIEHLVHPPADPVPPTYCAVRDDSLQAEGFVYVLYDTGEEELYDLDADPYELQNVASDPNYADELAYLRKRETRLCKPLPPGWGSSR